MMGFQKDRVDESIEVLKKQPSGMDYTVFFDRIYAEDGSGFYYKCPYDSCDGWIHGDPIMDFEDTLGPLAGRRGHSYRCRRCRREIAFDGRMG